MSSFPHASQIWRVCRWLAAVLILKTVGSVLSLFGNYFPPDFTEGFLFGREDHFYGPYAAAFYVHIVTGPLALILGLIGIADWFRLKWPTWHRRIGTVQIANVLFLVTPSGLWMAYWAADGPLSGLGLGCLAVCTALTAAAGWRAAVQRRFAAHRVWMWRCFLLLSSAVVLRTIVGVTIRLNFSIPQQEIVLSWASWITPVAVYEVIRKRTWTVKRNPTS